MLRTRTLVLVMTWLASSACVAERSLPKPAQMCENLVEQCGDRRIWGFEGLEECFHTGRAGIANPRDEDQCFAVYDECISDCTYYMYWTSFDTATDAADSGAESQSTTNTPDAAADAAVGASDATAVGEDAAATELAGDRADGGGGAEN